MTTLDQGFSYFILPAITFVAAHEITRNFDAAAFTAASTFCGALAWRHATPEQREFVGKATVITFTAVAIGTLLFLGTEKIEEAVPVGALAGFGTALVWPETTKKEENLPPPKDPKTPQELRDQFEALEKSAKNVDDDNVTQIYARLLRLQDHLSSFGGVSEEVDLDAIQKAQETGAVIHFQIKSYVSTRDDILRMKVDDVVDDRMKAQLEKLFHIVKVDDDGNCVPRAAVALACPILKPIVELHFSGDKKEALEQLRQMLNEQLITLGEQLDVVEEGKDPSAIFAEANKHDGTILPVLEWGRLQPLLKGKPDEKASETALCLMKAKLVQVIDKGKKALDKGWNEALNALLGVQIIRLRKQIQHHVTYGMANGEREQYQFRIFASLTGAQEAAKINGKASAGFKEALKDKDWAADAEHYYSPLSHWDNKDEETGVHWFGQVELTFMAEILGVDIAVYNGEPKTEEGKLVHNNNYLYPCGKENAKRICVWDARGQNHYYALLPKKEL